MGCASSVPALTAATSAPANSRAEIQPGPQLQTLPTDATPALPAADDSTNVASDEQNKARRDEADVGAQRSPEAPQKPEVEGIFVAENEHNSEMPVGSAVDQKQPAEETASVPPDSSVAAAADEGGFNSTQPGANQLGQLLLAPSAVTSVPYVEEQGPSHTPDTVMERHGADSQKEEVSAAFSRFDSSGDGVISREEMSRAISHLGLVPFGGDAEEVAKEVLALLKADDDSSVSLAVLKENFGALAGRLAQSGIDYDKANTIREALMRELSARGCLIAEGEAHPDTASAADRGVSLAVLLALRAAVEDIGDYDLPTFNFAIRSLCTTAVGEPLRFAQLLSPRHVGPPAAFVSHMWTAPIGEWPGERPFTYLAGQVVQHYSAEAMSPETLEETRVWVDLFAISQHPGREQKGDLDNLEKAVETADNTLLVLDPKGRTLTRIWCLLEIWVTAQAGAQLTILSKDIDGPAMKEVYTMLGVEEAQATMESDKESIMQRVKASGTGVKELNTLIKKALVESAEAEAKRHEGSGDNEAAWDALKKLATMMHFFTEDFGRAEELYRRVLEGQEKVLGATHSSTLRTVGNLANLLRQRDNLDGAEKMYRRALDGQEKVLGATHSDTLSTVGGLAALLYIRGDLVGAEKMCRRALDGQEKVLGATHSETLMYVFGLAILLGDKGDLDGAEKMYRRALEGQETALGNTHSDTLRTMSNLAGLLRDRGDLEEAEKMYRQALEGQEKALGATHSSTLLTVGNLANLLSDMDDLDGAEKMYRRALEGQEKVLGATHSSTLRTMGNLATLLRQRDNLDGAEKMFRRALEGQEKVLGATHSSTLRTVGNLANLLSDRGDLEGAEKMYRRALDGQEQALGATHSSTLRTMGNLAILLSDKGDLDEAEKMFCRALEGQEKALGATHSDTLRTMGNFANLLSRRGDLDEAKKMFCRALEGQEKILGSTHSDTLFTIRAFAMLLDKKCDLSGAEAMRARLP